MATGLQRIMLFVGVLTAAARLCSAASCPLSTSEEQLAAQIGFDREIARIAKDEAKSPVRRLSGYDEKGYQIMTRGLVVSVPQNRTDQVLAALRARLAPLRAMAFIVDINESIKVDRIGVIKGTDPYEILRVMYTNGAEDDISHEDVIDKLKEWEKKYSFDIIGAEHDWVEIQFRTLPGNIRAFAQEVYDFSPDIVDEDLGTVQELENDLLMTKRLMMWWE